MKKISETEEKPDTYIVVVKFKEKTTWQVLITARNLETCKKDIEFCKKFYKSQSAVIEIIRWFLLDGKTGVIDMIITPK